MSASLPPNLFDTALAAGASDVHIIVGQPLMFRIDGLLTPQSGEPIVAADAEAFIHDAIGEATFGRFKEQREVDVSHELASGVRLRINCHFERDNMGMVARVIPSDIPTLEDVGMEQIAAQFLQHREGLILFTGPTGTGKSTSLAAVIQHINETRAESIVTLEDPIEFLFPKGKSIIRQRQLGQDFLSYAEALKRVLRQDPNIVMVGEMRDPETIAAALTLAETGHLILATLHTPNAAQTIDRIIDVFAPYQQAQIRSQLSMSLRLVVAQRLLPHVNGGRIAQREVLLNSPALGNIIRDNRIQEIKSVLQTGADMGMVSFERSAEALYKKGLITKEVYEGAIGG